MSKKLTYLSINGLGEPIRYILHYSGQKFEDIWVDKTKWPIKSIKDSLPFGQFPVYEENGRKLNQSIAITRYVAYQAKLIPSDPWERAVLDAAVLNLYDFVSKISSAFFEADPAKKKALTEKLLGEHVDYYFSRFEKELKENNGYFGGKLSWADFVLVGIVEMVELFLGVQVQKDYPTVKALIEKVRNLPGVKEYIAKRKPYIF